MSFTLSSTEDIAHTSGKSDVKLTSNNRMNTQSTDNDNEICVTSIKKKAQHTSSVTNTGNKEKQTIDVSTQKHLSNTSTCLSSLKCLSANFVLRHGINWEK